MHRNPEETRLAAKELFQLGEQLPHHTKQILDVGDAFAHELLLGFIHLEADDALDTLGAENTRHTDEAPAALLARADAELILAVGGARDHALLVADDRFDHFDRAGAG